jgi:heat shock protein HtpX
MVERLSFEDQISSNKLKSFVLIAIMFVFFLIIGYIISAVLDPSYFFVVMIFSVIISLVYIWAGYFYSDRIALASVKAKPASNTEHRMLHHAVENMSLASGLPMPRVYVMESQEINAFASGRDPEHAVVCVTTGAIARLNKEELEGIIAHEMAHIANFDIRFMTLTAVLVGMISIAAEIFLRSLFFSNRDREGKGNAAILILGIVFAIAAPILAQLVSLAISRKREFGADATGAKFTRYPKGLANALKRIKTEHVSEQDTKKYPKAVAPLFISDPYKKKIQNIFSTHPDIDERIKRLEAM